MIRILESALWLTFIGFLAFASTEAFGQTQRPCMSYEEVSENLRAFELQIPVFAWIDPSTNSVKEVWFSESNSTATTIELLPGGIACFVGSTDQVWLREGIGDAIPEESS